MNSSDVDSWYKQSSITKGKLTPRGVNVVPLMSRPATGQITRKELEELRRLMAVRQALDEWKRKGFDVDIPICPICKSPRLVDLTSSHDLGVFPGFLQPAFYCLDCGWYGRLNITMSNRELEEAVLNDMSDAHPELLEDSSENDDELNEIN